MNIEHPYANFHDGQWVRGNLHAHTTQSDGSRPLQQVLDDYAARGYGYLMISDHDVLTLSQYQSLNGHGMILIPGNEITANGPHMLHVNACQRIEPSPQRQLVIQQAVASGGLVIVNHPNWEYHFNHCPITSLREWVGFTGIEIYNGVIERLDGSPYATDKWDMLLSAGRRVWGFANDDSHAPTGDVELGWNVTQLRDQSIDGVVDALLSGRFYPSTGVTLRNIVVQGKHIRIESENAQRIAAFKQVGQRFAVTDGNVIEVDIPDDATYVRFECYGDAGKRAWTQPFFIVKR
jgi:hypothetical protein